MNKKIYYCSFCAMRHRLPMRMGKLAAGYCRLCGVASSYVGFVTPKEATDRGVHVPTLEELAIGKYGGTNRHVGKNNKNLNIIINIPRRKFMSETPPSKFQFSKNIKVGNFMIFEKGIRKGRIHILHKSGEGGDFDKKKFEQVVKDFYNKYF